jgi:hydrogenase-4 component F
LFLLGTPDFKRMLAYSSVEHMGILSLGVGLGPLGTLAALYHVWNNSLTKGALFLSAGNMRRAAGARNVQDVSGMAWLTPVSSRIFIVGVFAVTACPPFGPFFSELGIVRAALDHPRFGWTMVIFLACLLFAFLGMTRLVFGIIDGRPRLAARKGERRLRERAGVIVPPLCLLGCSLWLGLAAPGILRESWAAAVKILFPAP